MLESEQLKKFFLSLKIKIEEKVQISGIYWIMSTTPVCGVCRK